MPLHRTGRNIIAAVLNGESITPLLTATGAVLWVGSGTGAHDAADNHLKGTSIAATMESGYPSRSVNALSYRGLYATNVANFEWQEWGVKNSTASATSTAANVFMLQRMQESLGTKANTQQWQLTVTNTLTT
jgi:hypothetical protein